jgi:hypothetical protein
MAGPYGHPFHPIAPNTAACCTPWPPAPGRSARPGPAAGWAWPGWRRAHGPAPSWSAWKIDTERAGLVASLFADLPHLAVLSGDWREIYRAAPFDLLVLDGGGYPPDQRNCSSRAAPSSSTT